MKPKTAVMNHADTRENNRCLFPFIQTEKHARPLFILWPLLLLIKGLRIPSPYPNLSLAPSPTSTDLGRSPRSRLGGEEVGRGDRWSRGHLRTCHMGVTGRRTWTSRPLIKRGSGMPTRCSWADAEPGRSIFWSSPGRTSAGRRRARARGGMIPR